MGITILEFNNTVLPIELGIREEVDGSIAAAGRERYDSVHPVSSTQKTP